MRPRNCLHVLLLLPLLVLFSAGSEKPFFFIQLSDPQFGMYSSDADFAQESANFDFAVATANRLKPAFVIVTGDLINKAADPAEASAYAGACSRLDRSIPLYNVAGNHDVGNKPTPESIAAYTTRFGPDRYSFRSGSLYGIVLNSTLIHSPQGAMELYRAQESWLESELEKAREAAAGRIVIFQHHPWFLKDPDEPDQYENIPRERRGPYLDRFRRFGVTHLFSGHYHRNQIARYGPMELIVTGPIGMPLGGEKSGMRVVIVRDAGLEHRYYEMGEIPNRIDISR
jgi:3',5'-cyclic AMP phosphodiesterase CpdA